MSIYRTNGIIKTNTRGILMQWEHSLTWFFDMDKLVGHIINVQNPCKIKGEHQYKSIGDKTEAVCLTMTRTVTLIPLWAKKTKRQHDAILIDTIHVVVKENWWYTFQWRTLDAVFACSELDLSSKCLQSIAADCIRVTKQKTFTVSQLLAMGHS